jgi:hypothetical protein
MNRIVISLLVLLCVPSWSWANEETAQPSKEGELRVKDLPKPIPELLEKLQQLSQKIEPEITKLGSTLGQELDETVKKLREEFQSRKRPASE